MPSHEQGFTTLAEEVEIEELPVSGHLPEWLSGTLVRNGPAQFEVGRESYNHWFDGLGMLRRFTFSEGTVAYANRFLRSGDYRESTGEGRIARRNFATNPGQSIVQRVLSVFAREPVDNANVNIGRFADRYVAMTETPLPFEFDPHTLETLGMLDYDQDDLGGVVTTAHPHFDSVRRQSINYLLQFSRKSRFIIYRMPEYSLRREPIASITMSRPSYVHSLGMSENHVILAEYPFVVNPLRMLVSGKPFIENYHWQPGRGARFHSIHKDEGSIRTYEAEAFYALHHVNAFERNGDIMVDIAAYPDPAIIDALYLDRLRAGSPIPSAELRRYRLPARGDTAEFERMSPESIELPRMNYGRHGGKPYRYAYGLSNRQDRPPEFANQVVKVDLSDRNATAWAEDGCFVGEPVFVAAPDAVAEDEGVLLTVVLDSARGRSFMVVLDAGTLEELARASAPHHLPFDLHGQFFAGQ